MKKLLVSLSTFALVIGTLALPVSAMPLTTSNVESKSVQPAKARVNKLPSSWIKHALSSYSYSGGDSVYLKDHGEHGFTILVDGNPEGISYKVSHAGSDVTGDLTQSQFILVEGDTANIYFYNTTGQEKNFKIKYTY